MMSLTLTVTFSIPALVLAPQAPAALALLPAPRPVLRLAPPAPVALLAAPAARFRLAAPAPVLALGAPLSAQERFTRDLLALLDGPVTLLRNYIGTPTSIWNAQTNRSICTVTMNGHNQTLIRFPFDDDERRYDFRLQDPLALHRLVVALTRPLSVK